MDATRWEGLARVAAAVVPALVALIGLTRGPGGMRSRLRHDVELLEKLPADSAPHAALLQHVESQVERLRSTESPNARRDWPSFAFALVSAPLLLSVTITLVQRGAAWQYAVATLTGVLAVVCFYGIFESAQRVPRTAKGKRLV